MNSRNRFWNTMLSLLAVWMMALSPLVSCSFAASAPVYLSADCPMCARAKMKACPMCAHHLPSKNSVAANSCECGSAHPAPFVIAEKSVFAPPHFVWIPLAARVFFDFKGEDASVFTTPTSSRPPPEPLAHALSPRAPPAL